MKHWILAAFALGALSFITAPPASAWTCKERMDACHNISGSPMCYEKDRCKGSTYYAPSGKTWSIDGKPRKKK